MVTKIQLSVAALALMGSVALASGVQAQETIVVAGATLKKNVQTAIHLKTALATDQISVEVLNNTVYLHGLVDTRLEREEAEAAARSVSAEAKVADLLEVNP